VVTRGSTTAVKVLVAAAIGTLVLIVPAAAVAMTWAGPETSPTTSALYGVSCPDVSHCFAVGGTTSAGKIIDTADAAANSPTWGTQTPPTNATGQYNAISCADDNDCVVVGNTSTGTPLILATANGGSSWSKQTPPSSATVALQGVSCASSTHCVAVGNVAGGSPVIIATSNGSTWTSQTAPTTNTPLNDVNCPSATVCYAVGGNSATATLLVTINGGLTWTPQTPPSGDGQALNAVTCTSTTVCFAVGNAISGTGEIVATTNGGVNWSYQSDGSQLSLYGVSCWDATDCVAVGASGRVVWTTNGTGWSWLNSPTSNTLYSVDVSNQTAGTAVGASGTILGYGSGGSCGSGGLTFTPPTSFSWPSTVLTGKDQSITTPLSLSPSDETGSGAGWNLTATSTTFTSSGHTLPTTAASITGAAATAGTGNCSLPTNQISYPVTVPAATTAPSAIKVFDAGSGTGAGPVNVALTASLNVPGNARTGTYTSTWTITLASGP
jgi:photosystem II stability/assembly factor-like uncharacterized protein